MPKWLYYDKKKLRKPKKKPGEMPLPPSIIEKRMEDKKKYLEERRENWKNRNKKKPLRYPKIR